MAGLAPEAHILCIDTWLGSPEMVSLNNNLYDHFRRSHGWPQIVLHVHLQRDSSCREREDLSSPDAVYGSRSASEQDGRSG